MTKTLLTGLAVALLPLTALAMPNLGDVVGTTPDEAAAALAAAGCAVQEFEAEAGMIEARCQSADGKAWEVYIDPASGAVAEIKEDS